MSERFTKLYELQKNLYSEGSPVVVSAGALLKDTQTNNIIVQLKFHSVSAKAIKALKVGIAAFDIAGKEIDGVSEYQFLDLNIHNGQEFGSNKAIVMPNLVTRSFSIKNITVVLADGCVQSVSLPFSPLPNPEAIQSVLADAELITQYKLKTNDSAVYIPQESLDLWQCHCGEWNSCSVCSRCNGQKSTIFAAFDLPLLTNEMNARLAEEAQRKAEIEQQKAEQARIQAEKKAKRNAAVKKSLKRTLIVFGGIVAICIVLIIAGIIFLSATDKPIDDDFAQSYEDSLHGLTYSVPNNWNYSSDESSENESWYTRYDNWGNFLGAMVVSYEGESPDVTTVDSVVAEFKEECSTAKIRTENINGQEFEVVTFMMESSDATPFFYNIYVTETDYSVFYVSFIFIEESNKTNIFDEIIGAMAFDEYVNPKEELYNEASQLIADGEYKRAYNILVPLGDYRNCSELIEKCLSAEFEENIAQLIIDKKYSEAYSLLISNKDTDRLKYFKAVHTESSYSDKYYNSTTSYTYDDLGDLIKSVETYEDGDTEVTEYAYDENHRLIRETITDSDMFETTYTYDSDGRLLTETSEYNGNSYTYTYSYDENGNMIKKSYTKSGEYGERITEYEYNSNGQVIKELNPDGTYTYYEYGSNNELLREVYVWSDGHESFDSYQYDENGYLVKEIDSYGNSVEYSYDSNYFLVKKVEYDENQIDSITEYGEYKVFYLFAD